jgi:uncharacterized cofD-like protein
MATRRKRPQHPHTFWSLALRPGLGLKRWVVLLFFGVTVSGLGLAFFIRKFYLTSSWPMALDWLTLRFLPDWLRGVILLGVGLALVAYSVWRFNNVLVSAVAPESSVGAMSALVQQRQRQQRRHGPKIVAIGGGTGMPQLLRGLRVFTDNLTAIVTVADDGGSSGRLRRQMGMLPPGDFRNNIAALSEAEDLMTRLFQYRFPQSQPNDKTDDGVDPDDGLAGHSFGNLFITTMAAVTGSFEAGIAESSRVLAVRGRVLPSTLDQVVLGAEIVRTGEDGGEDWQVVHGESELPRQGGRIVRVFLQPEQPRAYPLAVQAILQADLIVACPGSFFTSLLPNLLVPGIRDAIRAASALRVFICNVATQPGETDGYSVSEHVHQLREHGGDAFNVVLANSNYDPAQPPSSYGQWVTLPAANEMIDYQLVTGDVVDDQLPWHHSPSKLAACLMEVYANWTERPKSAEPRSATPAPVADEREQALVID